MSGTEKGSGVEYDVDALRQKYRHERDRRLVAAGDNQYAEAKGAFAKIADTDPFCGDAPNREPQQIETTVAIVGAGWAGMYAAIRLKDRGVNDFRIIDDAADFGGTWYWNRYPGAQCDIESYCYLPLLEETGYIPKEKYSMGPEIFDHAKRIGQLFGLTDHALFRTRVIAMDWQDDTHRWAISTNHGDRISAQFVVMCSGPFHRPKLPGVEGMETFKGHVFHTSRWDYNYTGGSPEGNLTGLADKRVAVIGTGATAIQCIPHVARAAKHTYIFQRTPSSIDVRGNRPTDFEWAKTLQPGWQRKRQDNFNDVVRGAPFEEDLVNDGWTDIFRRVKAGNFTFSEDAAANESEIAMLKAELADFEKMNEIRKRVESVVEDPETAEALKPYYRQFCKRPCFSDDYLPVFNQPNVTLIDTSGTRGIERITENGVVANGKEYAVDCIIYATGFEAASSWRRRMGVEIHGRNGIDLFDYWKDGLRTLHGHSTHNFPNWFYIGLSQIGASFNFAPIADTMAGHVAYIISTALERGGRHATVEATVEGEEDWVREIRSHAATNESFLESCTPGYYNNEGGFKNTPQRFNGDFYAPGLNIFAELLDQWRKDGNLSGMELQAHDAKAEP